MPQTIQRSFTSGEIAPALRSRADLLKYATGLALCQNFIVQAQGGVYSRSGTRFTNELTDSSRRGRLIPFSFNTEQTYMLVFEHLKMSVIRDGGAYLTTITTPYTEEQLSRIGFTQSADVMTLTHLEHDPANLSRLSDSNWVLADIDFSPTVDAPELANEEVVVITGITQADPAVVTATNTLLENVTVVVRGVVGMTEVNDRAFVIQNVTGSQFELRDEDSTAHTAYVSDGTATRGSLNKVGSGFGTELKTFTYVVTAVDEDGVESLPSLFSSIEVESLSITGGLRLTWVAVPGADHYRVYKDPSVNTEVYGWIGDSKTLSFDDYNVAPITSDAPPSDRQPFAEADDKPAAVNYYQQRQVFANTNNEPQVFFTTQIANFKSLRTSAPTRDDDAITYAIVGKQVNEIRHIVALDALLFLTSGGEWRATEGESQVLTPSTVGARIQTYNGASWVPPAIANDTVLYVQEKGGRIRDLNYQFSSNKYTGDDLSVMSEHLFEDHTIEEMAYADEPYGVLWCVRDDGVLLGLTYLREHQVWGWHKHITDGVFESVATISEDGRDAVYVIVKRTIKGVTRRYVERLEARITNVVEDCFYVDSGLSYDGVPVTEVTGLDHLESKTVVALADGNVVLDLVVNSGKVTLPTAASKIHVGLAYLPAIELLDIDLASTSETLKGKEVSVARVVLEVEKSRGGWIGPIDDNGVTDNMVEIKPRFESDEYDTISLKTFKEEVVVQPEWNQGGGLRIEQRAPLPLSILSVIPNVDIGG